MKKPPDAGAVPAISTLKKKGFKIPVNEEIKAREVRVVDENGKQLGIFNLEEALKMAKERNLDLVQVTEKVFPPVCKILDYGKYLYQKKKKEGKPKKAGKIKEIRLSFGILEHDLETRVKQTEKFLKNGYKVRVVMRLEGREKTLLDFAKSKFEKFLEDLKKETAIKIEKELKREPRGLTMIIVKS